MKILFFKVLISLLFTISNISCIDFFFNIDQFAHKCLGEYLTEHTTGNLNKIHKNFNKNKQQFFTLNRKKPSQPNYSIPTE